MNINLIKPQNKGISDKYSWQLYQYIRKRFPYTKSLNDVRVYWDNISSWDGSITNLDENNINIRQIIIGKMHSNLLSGSRLLTIMGQDKDKYEMFCYHPIGGWKNEQFIDITDWFWKKYIKLGRCLLDKHHNRWWMNDDCRFTYINNTRRCNWCGQWQKKEIKKEVKILRKEKWVNE